MLCKQVRALFSSRLDGELKPEDARSVQDHLSGCAGCRERWASFELTVRMIRSLPPAAPDPSFVGQVLDRVRAYEAGELADVSLDRRALARASRPSGAFGRGMAGLLAILRPVRVPLEALSEGVEWGRWASPLRLAGATVFGVALGFLGSSLGFFDLGHGPSPFASAPAVVSSQASGDAGKHSRLTLEQIGNAGEVSGPSRPGASGTERFADLASRFASSSGSGETGTDSSRSRAGNAAEPLSPINGGASGPGLTVRMDGGNGAPKIIF